MFEIKGFERSGLKDRKRYEELFMLPLILSIPSLIFIDSLPRIALFLVWTLFLLRLPSIVLKIMIEKRKKRIDSDISFAVKYFAQMLLMGLPFRKAYENIVESDFGLISTLLREAMEKKKIHLKDALLEVEKTTDSRKFSEFISLIIQTERSGPNKNLIRTAEIMGDRFFEESIQDYRKFTSQSQLIFMMHITITALLPTVVALIIGTSDVISGKTIPDLLINLIFIFVIPVFSLMELGYLEVKRPC